MSNEKPDTTSPRKGKITRKGLRDAFKLYKYIKPYQGEYFLGLFFLIGSSLASLAFPKLLGDLIPGQEESTTGLPINQVALIMCIVLVMQATFSYFRVILFVNVTEKSLAGLRRATYNHLIKLPLQFFEKKRVGELNSRISADVTLLQETLTTTLAEFIRQIIIIIGGIILLGFTSIKLTVFMLLIVPPVMVIARFFGRFIRKISKNVQKEVASSNTIIEETLQGIQSVKAYTNESTEIKRYHKITDEIAKLGMKSGRYRGAFSSFIIFGLFGAIVAVVWQGSIMMQNGLLEAGELFSFVIYSVFVGGNIGGLAGVFANIQKFIGATEDLFELFEEKEEKLIDTITIPEKYKLNGKISFNKLSFYYPGRPDEKVLKDITLAIQPNNLIAIVGPSGAGKSTLASLLLKLHYPGKNQILYDDQDIHKIPLSILRKQIALVPQDIFLFGGSIKENIAYGKPNATDDELHDAALKANALEFINRFPDGMDTLVGERGTQLSGGQRQRIAIARAILKNPKILILDEATSALDSESERLVQEALEKLMKGRTSIVIAHRLSTIRKADNIVVIDHGKVVEQGTHAELIKKQEGTYKALSEMQFSLSDL